MKSMLTHTHKSHSHPSIQTTVRQPKQPLLKQKSMFAGETSKLASARERRIQTIFAEIKPKMETAVDSNKENSRNMKL
jgi:hypothetical protein